MSYAYNKKRGGGHSGASLFMIPKRRGHRGKPKSVRCGLPSSRKLHSPLIRAQHLLAGLHCYNASRLQAEDKERLRQESRDARVHQEAMVQRTQKTQPKLWEKIKNLLKRKVW